MATRRIALTNLDGRVPLRLGPRGVHEDHARAAALLASLAGAEAARLFAAPALTLGNGSAGGSAEWSSDLPGDVLPLDRLAPGAREETVVRLRRLLARLVPLLEDQEVGAWLRRALVVPPGEQSILSVGGAPVLVDWGLADPAMPEDPATLERAIRTGLGRYLPASAFAAPPPAPPPPAAVASAPGPAAAAAPSPPSPAARAAAAPAMVAAVAPPPPPVPPRSPARFLIPAAIAVAALFLGLGVWIGARMVAERLAAAPRTIPLVQDEEALRRALALQREQNAALEARIAEVREATQGNMCVATPGSLPSLGPDRAAPVQPAALPPPAPGAAPARFEGGLAALLDQAVVLVVVRGQAGMGTGSGFFITPELIVTNRHVLETGSAVVVASRAIGGVQPAEVVMRTPSSDAGAPDFAVLRVPAQRVQPLGLTRVAGRLDQVIAAGFPAVVSETDAAYAAVIEGDASAVQRLQPVLSDGRIQAVQPFPSGLQAMPHSAQIAPGSSGGPLVDACGRVVGVNTFGRTTPDLPVTVNYAQKADTLLEVLRGAGVTAAELEGACAPAPAVAPATPAPATPGPGAPATPAPATPAPPAGGTR